MHHNPCYKVILSYDGSEFCGWEKQAQGERTVRGVVEEALHRLTGKPVSIIAAGRTDSGVHALGQVVSFQTDKNWDRQALGKGMNALLPRDVRVLSVLTVPPDFHARFTALHKTYFYQILEAPFDDPFRRRFFHRVKRIPDVGKLREAAALLVGERDFSALMAAGSDVRTTRRRVVSIKVRRGKDWVRIFYTADGFLYRMVRNMTAMLMAVAEGTLAPGRAERILASGDRSLAPATYPAKGLYLWRIHY
jgi:tRNA pseudouridine38-40 synthase